jgi:hypothetical protein
MNWNIMVYQDIVSYPVDVDISLEHVYFVFSIFAFGY